MGYIPPMQPVQWVSLVLSVVLIILCVWVMRLKVGKELEYLPWMIWFVHTLLFYTALSVRFAPMMGQYGDWGSILRLHGYLTICYHLAYKVIQHYAIK